MKKDRVMVSIVTMTSMRSVRGSDCTDLCYSCSVCHSRRAQQLMAAQLTIALFDRLYDLATVVIAVQRSENVKQWLCVRSNDNNASTAAAAGELRR